MRRFAGSLLYATVFLAVSACAQTVQVRVTDVKPNFAWPEPGQTPRVEAAVTVEQVTEYLSAVSEKLSSDPSVKVQQFTFARLSPGRATLVARTASSSEYYYYVTVVDWDGTSSYVRVLPANPPYDLETELSDIDGDWLCEIVTNNLALGYQGAFTKPIGWKQVLKARADYTFEDVSQRNRSYFEKRVIPELDQLNAKLDSKYEPGPNLEQARAGVQYVRDKYRRMLYGEREAGLQNAQAWLQSSDSDIRHMGANALADINTQAARDILSRLRYSSDLVIEHIADRVLDQPASDPR